MANSIAIVAVGMVSSVGRGAADTCASIRAGINRMGPVSHLPMLGEDPGVPAALQGHAIVGLTDGLAPNARWLVMSQRALADLMAGHSPAAQGQGSYWARCGIVFVLPVLADGRFFHAPLARPEAIWASCLNPVMKVQRLPLHPDRRALISTGPAGIGKAFETAGTWLEKREIDRVLIVASDSLLDAWSLEWLGHSGRLKCADNPVGTVPGEAAVALLVERREDNPETRPIAYTRAVAFEKIDEPFQRGGRRNGRGLVTVVQRALEKGDARLDGDIYVNLNGEEWRAAEFGAALTAIGPSALGVHRVVAAATSVGDLGAAAGTMQIACALRSFVRGYSMSPHAWILSTSDYGDVSALCLEAAQHG